MVEVINIPKEHEVLLGFLYPDYTITDSSSVIRKFITHREVKSKRERESLEVLFEDCVFISTQIFDQYWDKEIIKQKAVEFSRKKFKNRHRTITANDDTFNQDIINFMFGIDYPEQESSIVELFDSVGSNNFIKVFMQKSQTIPVPVMSAALNTFVTRILNSDTSIYYRKKAMIFGDKIRNNIISSLDNLALRYNDEFGLSIARFYTDLVQ